ncbi:MAG: deoxyribodipyrimidine photo-lyase, partial [Rudaea sp.]
WWLHHSLAALDAELRLCGATLHIRCGPSQLALDTLLRETCATAVYWNRLYEPALVERDAHIKRTLREAGVDAISFKANLLIEPWQIATGQGGPYKVFTPYWRKLRAQLQPSPPLPRPSRISSPALSDRTGLDAMNLLPRIGWDAAFARYWKPGEVGARALLKDFLVDAVNEYPDGRDRPDREWTSRLSAHLHFGEISPQQVFWALEENARDASSSHGDVGAEAFLRELGWREFSHHLLFHFPAIAQQNLNAQFDAFAWAHDDADVLARWQRGQTGVPIVDAGMRQLWETGWMHNRVRMIVGSFLTKNLRQHWLHGARWFWDTLVDADLANNTQGWQWTAGCGADAAPYFRIFNPVTQGERFDPQGDYVRRWVAELADVRAPLIHQPWKQPDLLRRFGYPPPMVDLRESREAALLAYQQMRGAST